MKKPFDLETSHPLKKLYGGSDCMRACLRACGGRALHAGVRNCLRVLSTKSASLRLRTSPSAVTRSTSDDVLHVHKMIGKRSNWQIHVSIGRHATQAADGHSSLGFATMPITSTARLNLILQPIRNRMSLSRT